MIFMFFKFPPSLNIISRVLIFYLIINPLNYKCSSSTSYICLGDSPISYPPYWREFVLKIVPLEIQEIVLYHTLILKENLLSNSYNLKIPYQGRIATHIFLANDFILKPLIDIFKRSFHANDFIWNLWWSIITCYNCSSRSLLWRPKYYIKLLLFDKKI